MPYVLDSVILSPDIVQQDSRFAGCTAAFLGYPDADPATKLQEIKSTPRAGSVCPTRSQNQN